MIKKNYTSTNKTGSYEFEKIILKSKNFRSMWKNSKNINYWKNAPREGTNPLRNAKPALFAQFAQIDNSTRYWLMILMVGAVNNNTQYSSKSVESWYIASRILMKKLNKIDIKNFNLKIERFIPFAFERCWVVQLSNEFEIDCETGVIIIEELIGLLVRETSGSRG